MKIKQHFQQRVVCFFFIHLTAGDSLAALQQNTCFQIIRVMENVNCQLGLQISSQNRGRGQQRFPALFLFFLLSECLRLTLIVMDSGTCVSKYRQKVAPGQWPPKTSLLFLLFFILHISIQNNSQPQLERECVDSFGSDNSQVEVVC